MKNRLRLLLTFLIVSMAIASVPAMAESPSTSVRSFGAKGDGKTDDTAAIQQAIDACASGGGGTVTLPAGTYLCRPIFLKSNITLHLDPGSVVLGSKNFDDYPVIQGRWEGIEREHKAALITGIGLENIAVEGHGVINGQGEVWWSDYKKFFKLSESLTANPTTPPAGVSVQDIQRYKYPRPRLVNLINCRNIVIRDVKLVNSPSWTLHLAYCENIVADGLTLEAPEDSPNTDGVDLDSCRLARVSNCYMSLGDDCVVIKSGKGPDGRRVGKPCENITVTNCTMGKGHGGVVIGSEMSGGVRNVAVSNCVFDGTQRGIRIKTCRGRGGTVENISYSNLVMRGMQKEAISITMVYEGKVDHAKPEPVTEATPTLRNISISNIRADGASDALVCEGLPEMPVTGVSMSNVRINAKRGMRWISAKDIDLQNVQVTCSDGPTMQRTNTQEFRISKPGPAEENK